MRIFSITPHSVSESDALPTERPAQGFIWIACTRREFEEPPVLAQLQSTLQTLCGVQLVDLHVSDLRNRQLPSHYDYTAQYDIVVFRRLAAAGTNVDVTQAVAHHYGVAEPEASTLQKQKRNGPPILQRIDTSPVGFAVFDQVLLSVHPSDCSVRDSFAQRLLHAALPEQRASGGRPSHSPADLMLRIVNHIVDSYLELRRELTRQLEHWQAELLHPHTRFNNWPTLLQTRMVLHSLDEICEDQRVTIQSWIEAVNSWPDVATPAEQRDRDLLQVRGRDVLEHIERVVHHVRRLEQNVETAVQMHFSVQSNRANDIMRTLTTLTAIFLPLNLIAGIFGMNFEFIPFAHQQSGFWWAMGAMLFIALLLGVVFWRKRYLARSGK